MGRDAFRNEADGPMSILIVEDDPLVAKEAAEKYGWKRLAAVNSDNALNANRAIQEIIETVLMFADIFIS